MALEAVCDDVLSSGSGWFNAAAAADSSRDTCGCCRVGGTSKGALVEESAEENAVARCSGCCVTTEARIGVVGDDSSSEESDSNTIPIPFARVTVKGAAAEVEKRGEALDLEECCKGSVVEAAIVAARARL